ncbi:PIN domain-containing protein [Luteolibacter flavescens]|uniref:PIN domain-containing protein n=1 Tax=Luteolibacter flavescens TaxID=1859460 RepID=A0ABT3FMQ9_9BACT|nr:PIN domain-containing protein [Luteolibacter flavescens]MCW1884855.1 PIN domain-containing protein [Luteolibacter flavescens]
MHSDPASSPVNHFFVDFENVKEKDLPVLGREDHIVYLFLGPLHKKLDVGMVERLLQNSQAVKMIRSPRPGKNALDFVLAYHLGQAVQTDPRGIFHLISRDEGFDSLVDLLKGRGVRVKRHDSWAALESPKPAENGNHAASRTGDLNGGPATNGSGRVPESDEEAEASAISYGAEKFLRNLKKSAKNRPKKKSTLVSHAKSMLDKDAGEEEAEKVVEELLKAGSLKFDSKGEVTYLL